MRGALLAARWARRVPLPRRRAAMASAGGDAPPLQTAVVRAADGDPALTITLSLAGRTRYMSRPRDEPLAKCLDRMARSAAAPGGKKKGGAAAAAAPPPTATLFADPQRTRPIPGTTLNGDAWPAAGGAVLEVGGAAYRVIVNPPTVVKAAVSGAAIVGCPLAPALDLAFAEPAACRYQWQRRKPPAGAAAAVAEAATGTPLAPPPAAGADGWAAVPADDGNDGRGASYTPTLDDVGCSLRVVVTPGSVVGGPGPGPWFGEPTAAAAAGVVEPGPASRAADGRADAVPSPTSPPRLRVVTYNLLADQYAATDTARDVLFAHCPPHHLDPAYRRSLAAAELVAYAADIVCLQEVDEKAFDGVLRPVLAAAGYKGRYTNKASSVREGAALFWRDDRFECVAWRDVVLKDVFAAVLAGGGDGTTDAGDGDTDATALAARHGRLLPVLRSSAWLRDALAKVSTIAQVAVLRPRPRAVAAAVPDGALVITNTHLFFHPGAPHIRTLHVTAALTEAADVAGRAVAAGVVSTPPSPLFCGDLNSDLNDGVPGTIELLREGALSSGFWDWALGASFRYDADGVADAEPGVPLAAPDPRASPSDGLTPVDLAIPFHLTPSDGLATPYTNYVRGYSGLLDYVWTDARALASVGGPPPPLDRVCGDAFIPNDVFPSDHVAVIADLEWRPLEEREAALAAPPPSSAVAPRGAPPPPHAPPSAGGPPPRAVAADDAGLAVALLALHSGALALLPTDTLYGVAADACCPSAVAAVYAAKRRDGAVPLAISVADVADVARYGDADALPAGLLAALLPGAVTVVLARRACAPLSAALNPGVATIGVRVPGAPWIRALAAAHGGAIALTSANESGAPPAREVGEAAAVMESVSVAVDGGRVGAGRAGSTVVDLSAVKGPDPPHNAYAVLREGEGVAGVRATLARFGLREAA